MATDDNIRDEQLQYDIKREAAKISALSFGKINKYEYLTDEEILSSDQSKVIEQAKFTNSPLGKAFQKQKKQVGVVTPLEIPNKRDKLKKIEGIFPQNMMNDLICEKLKKFLICKIILRQMIYVIN